MKPKQKRNRKFTPLTERFWKYVSKTNDCWLWTGTTISFGYGVINTGGHNGKAERAHRVSWMIHHGEIPTDLCVCHRCDNPLCVNPAHLFLGTRADNNHDMQRKGRIDRVKRPKGERHGMAKLTDADVLAIRSAFSTGATIRSLAAQYSVTFPSVWRIIHRQNWKHI